MGAMLLLFLPLLFAGMGAYPFFCCIIDLKPTLPFTVATFPTILIVSGQKHTSGKLA